MRYEKSYDMKNWFKTNEKMIREFADYKDVDLFINGLTEKPVRLNSFSWVRKLS